MPSSKNSSNYAFRYGLRRLATTPTAKSGLKPGTYTERMDVYVSKKAGERVMGSLTRFLEGRLKLRVNQAKSAVARPWERVFLGYSMTFQKESRIKVASQSVKRLKSKVKERIRQGRGRNVSRFIREDLNLLLQGWIQYFRLAEVRGTFEELDGWIRRKLRCIVWRQWKRSGTRYRKLLERNIVEERSRMSAFNPEFAVAICCGL